MTDSNSVIAGVVVLAALVALVSFVIRGRGFKPASSARGERPVGNRSAFEVFFAVLAIANLAVSPSASHLGVPVVVLGMVLLAGSYAFASSIGLAIVVIGAVAAVADIAVTEGMGVAVSVGVIALFLAWIFGAVRLARAGGR